MWKLLSLCVLVVAIDGYQTSSDHELLATGSVIYTVDKRLEKLKKDLEKAPKFSLEDAYAKVAQKIEDLEEHCEKGQFQCGGTLYQCVNPLKVCDEVKDCLNGHDEDLDVCFKDFLALGTVFDYRLTWYSCETWPDKNYLLRVRELTRSKFFAGTAKVTFDFGSGKYGIWKGEYNYGKRKLVLLPTDKELRPYKIICDFSGSKTRTDCLVETVSSNFVCGHGFLYHNY